MEAIKRVEFICYCERALRWLAIHRWTYQPYFERKLFEVAYFNLCDHGTVPERYRQTDNLLWHHRAMCSMAL